MPEPWHRLLRAPVLQRQTLTITTTSPSLFTGPSVSFRLRTSTSSHISRFSTLKLDWSSLCSCVANWKAVNCSRDALWPQQTRDLHQLAIKAGAPYMPTGKSYKNEQAPYPPKKARAALFAHISFFASQLHGNSQLKVRVAWRGRDTPHL